MSFHLQQAELSLQSARLLLATDDTTSTISRAYYACFDAARATLEALVGDEAGRVKTHSGLIRLFSLEVVKPGHVSAAASAILSRAQDLRLVADYGDDRPSVEDATEAVESAAQFVALCRSLIEQEKLS